MTSVYLAALHGYCIHIFQLLTHIRRFGNSGIIVFNSLCYIRRMELSEAAAAFSALSQESRLKVLIALLSAGPGGLSAGSLAEGVAIPPSTLSFHLAALERAGLARATRQGRQILYSPVVDRLSTLFSFLADTCCGSRPELCQDLTASRAGSVQPSTVTPTFNVLFVCSRNSARSIIAEAILSRVGRGRFNAYSAGVKPATKVMPEVLGMLKRLEYDWTRLRSKSWNVFAKPDAPRMDFVIALCDVFDEYAYPDLGDNSIMSVWPLPDPAQFRGDGKERALLLNELYVALHRRIESFIALPLAALNWAELKTKVDEIAANGVT